MKSAIVKRSVIIRGHKTSISLEDVFLGSFVEYGACTTVYALEIGR